MKAIFAKPWWPHLRAALILFHVIAITAGSIPVLVDERAMTKDAWQDPVAQEEFEKWAERLGGDWTAQEVELIAWSLANGLLDFQSAAKAPFEPYYDYLGTRQRWRMFPAAVKNPKRFRIDIQTDGKWETVYLMGSKEKSWLADYFDRDRFRSLLNLMAWESIDRTGFRMWVMAQAADQFPHADYIKVGFEVLPALKKTEAIAGNPPIPRSFSTGDWGGPEIVPLHIFREHRSP
ncbi:MAG: hypothetical protein AAGJ79_08650 [Verrucomicrobiota bacterium]